MYREEADEGQRWRWVGGQITGMKARRAEDVQAARGGEAVEQRDGLTQRGYQGTCSVTFCPRTDTLQ